MSERDRLVGRALQWSRCVIAAESHRLFAGDEAVPVLQWSRCVIAAESHHAGELPPHVVLASMEPLRDRSGEVAKRPAGRGPDGRFNGAAA